MFGAPGEDRTPNPQIRSLMLYTIELRVLNSVSSLGLFSSDFKLVFFESWVKLSLINEG